MLRRSIALLAPLLLAASLSASAQSAAPTPATKPPGWTPKIVEELGQHASFHTDFTFDRAMLRFLGNFTDNGDADTQRAVNKLDAISVHSYHFPQPELYDPRILKTIRADYAATGWKHLVTARPNGDPFRSGETDRTDLWISLSHANVTGMIVLVETAKDVDLIAITGNLSPLDLLHLRGHFGIPRFDAGDLAPAPAEPPQDGLETGPAQTGPDYAAPAPPQP